LELSYTGEDNPNGNASRPYYVCPFEHDYEATNFLGFADERGNAAYNPPCWCYTPSKATITKKTLGGRRVF
jgi:hypothetical protein